MAAITLKDVRKKYGKVDAVRGVSMEIGDGEFVSFLGPSGCGKSSTMRMIAGLEEITSGDIHFGGESVIRQEPAARNIAMAFENYALYPTLNVFENVAFPLRSAGVKGEEVKRQVHEMAEVVGLSHLLDKRPSALSSGQAQSVGLARALIRRPNALLLDEPISHLDTSQRFAMRMYMKRLHIDLGYTTILVTHDQEDAMSMADRVAVMERGTLHQTATPQEIYDRPVNRFVASFIGDIPMNFLPCTPVEEDGKTHLIGEGFRIPLPDRIPASRLTPTMEIGIRPHDLTVVPGLVEGGFAARVLSVDMLGDMNVVLAEIGATKIHAAISVDAEPKRGSTVWFAPDATRSKFFDDDGNNIEVAPAGG